MSVFVSAITAILVLMFSLITNSFHEVVGRGQGLAQGKIKESAESPGPELSIREKHFHSDDAWSQIGHFDQQSLSGQDAPMASRSKELSAMMNRMANLDSR